MIGSSVTLAKLTDLHGATKLLRQVGWQVRHHCNDRIFEITTELRLEAFCQILPQNKPANFMNIF